MDSQPEHFRGKSVVEHLREAREKGALASAEIHGAEMPGALAAGGDASKETVAVFLILWILLLHFSSGSNLTFLSLFAAGWVLWKTGRSATLGWARMDRLHRQIEEERWEIEHHRAQEKLELTEMYRAKGLDGKLLEEVVDVLMADDNRLLRIMLEEELGLTLEAYEHPLKQGFGAFCGAFISSFFCLAAFWISASWGIPIAGGLLLMFSVAMTSKWEGNPYLNKIVWSLAIAGAVTGFVYFLIRLRL